MPRLVGTPCPVRRLTPLEPAHFFGYYEKSPWRADGQVLLGLAAADRHRLPAPGEAATIGLIDAAKGGFEPIAETRGWNWQQGCMLQWLPPDFSSRIVYNDVRDGQVVAVIRELAGGGERVLPGMVYHLAADGSFALSLNPARLADTRPVVGYAGLTDPWADQAAPGGDGVWRLDLATGERRLLLSLATAVAHEHRADMDGVKHRFEHAMVSPDGQRCFVLQRWKRATPEPGADFVRRFHDRLLSADTADGGSLWAPPLDDFVSHFDWRDPAHYLVWAQHRGERAFWLVRDRDDVVGSLAPGVLTRDGHCSHSPDGRFLLTDTYPSGEGRRHLLVYDLVEEVAHDVGRFRSTPPLDKGEIRCDLHPRWSRDGTEVCLDSCHEGPRQMYVVDVSRITLG